MFAKLRALLHRQRLPPPDALARGQAAWQREYEKRLAVVQNLERQQGVTAELNRLRKGEENR